MITKINTIDILRQGLYKVTFDYRGAVRTTILTEMGVDYLKRRTPNLKRLFIGMSIDVIKQVKPSRNPPHQPVELFKIAEAYV